MCSKSGNITTVKLIIIIIWHTMPTIWMDIVYFKPYLYGKVRLVNLHFCPLFEQNCIFLFRVPLPYIQGYDPFQPGIWPFPPRDMTLQPKDMTNWMDTVYSAIEVFQWKTSSIVAISKYELYVLYWNVHI